MSMDELLSPAVTTEQARTDIHDVPGVYAWWVCPGALPGISGRAHPAGDLELIYVGIARSGPTSRATLRSRVVSNHIRGTTGQSTLRRSLASLLWGSQGWRSRLADRPLLVPQDEQRLTGWMQEHLRLTWVTHAEPWMVEAEMIASLQPPLNQSANRTHPLYGHVRDARRRWREEALRSTDE